MFVVTGATGNVGGEVVTGLVDRGVPVRALVRNPSAVAPVEGVEFVQADLTDPASARAAMSGAAAVFLLPGYPGLAAAAAAAGARRIVQLSGGSAGSGDGSNAVTKYLNDTEAEMRDSGLEWTVLRPTAFMTNALRWKDQIQAGDVVRLPFADVPLAVVHPRDLAAVAVVAMVESGHQSMVCRPTGPAVLSLEEQVATVGESLGRSLRFEAQPNDEARREMLKTTPAPYVAAFFDFYVNGSIDETTVRPTVDDVTGRPPRTFRDWAAENAHRFAS
ncbi:NAD(P)H-binding protein [Paractinoplanes maris]|uniref:NAD(P)H-binding protein n=1 Tax=Paractinoplanes maris TaxID=1734446 RepID=UPI00201FEA94|nr:NAD(P)H-binding protein [Actinoplanes maris]